MEKYARLARKCVENKKKDGKVCVCRVEYLPLHPKTDCNAHRNEIGAWMSLPATNEPPYSIPYVEAVYL